MTMTYEEMVEEAIVDCYSREEALAGFAVTVVDNLKFPFKATVLGKEVEVVGAEEKSIVVAKVRFVESTALLRSEQKTASNLVLISPFNFIDCPTPRSESSPWFQPVEIPFSLSVVVPWTK